MKHYLRALQTKIQQYHVVQMVTVFAMSLATEAAVAATSGSEFKKFAEMIQGWAEGYLGMALALCAFLIGLSVGLMKQTLMPALVGLGVALFATMGPSVLVSMFTAII